MKKISIDLLRNFLNEEQLKEIISEAQKRNSQSAWYLELFDETERLMFNDFNKFLKELSKKYNLALGVYNNTKRAKISKKQYLENKKGV